MLPLPEIPQDVNVVWRQAKSWRPPRSDREVLLVFPARCKTMRVAARDVNEVPQGALLIEVFADLVVVWC